MRLLSPSPWLALGVLCATPASSQVVFLQNDSFAGGSVSCQLGIADSETLAAKFTALPGQYPYTIDRIRVFGCGQAGGVDGFVVSIYQDDGGTAAPGPLLWLGTAYTVTGDNVFSDLMVSSEATPPPTISSGSIRVGLFKLQFTGIGIGADTNGIIPQRNYLRNTSGGWNFAENQGLPGDWILRVGILPNTPVELQSFTIE